MIMKAGGLCLCQIPEKVTGRTSGETDIKRRYYRRGRELRIFSEPCLFLKMRVKYRKNNQVKGFDV